MEEDSGVCFPLPKGSPPRIARRARGTPVSPLVNRLKPGAAVHSKNLIRNLPALTFAHSDSVPAPITGSGLPIGYGQTISQPTIVVLMTDLLEPRRGQVVLEIGTGSGYKAAVLADLGLRVYTMEIIRPLAGGR